MDTEQESNVNGSTGDEVYVGVDLPMTLVVFAMIESVARRSWFGWTANTPRVNTAPA